MPIRPSSENDLEAILSIWLDASIKAHDFVPSDFWQSQLDAMRTIYIPASETSVFEEGGLIQGFYSLYQNTLAAIFVAPDLQGGGIGTSLLNDAKSKRNELELTVYKANEPSVQFYLAQGFEIIKQQTDEHTGHPELLMRFKA